MERKYYLRGLGLGIVMTAVIMGIALSGSRKMTDEEIIKRAKELGMVEDTYLAETVQDEEQTQQDIEDAEKKDSGTTQQKPAAETKPASSQEPVEAPLEEEANPPEEELPVAQPVEEEPGEAEADNAETEESQQLSEAGHTQNTNEMTRQEETQSSSVKIQRVTIASGDGSYTVALKLKEAGVVMSAETFDTFLCEKGYDKKLRTGTFQIPSDASDEQIARIITGQE